MTNMTYLHIRGVLLENMVYSPLPGNESPRRGRPIEGDPAFQLALLDDAAEVVLSVAPEVKPSGCRAAEDLLEFDVRGLLPLHPAATAYELRRGDILLHRAEISAEAPIPPTVRYRCNDTTVSLDGIAGCDPTTNNSSGKTYSITAVMQSGRRFVIASNLVDAEHSFDLGNLPVPGRGAICLGVHDGVRSTEVEVGAIDVPARAPVVHILKPEPYARIPFGQPVSILGCCLGMDQRPYSSDGLSWMIDDALFATSSNVVALEGLQPGEHRLTLCNEGQNPADRAETSVIFEIEESGEAYDLWAALAQGLDRP